MRGINLIPAHRRAARERRRRLRCWVGAIAGYGGIMVAACTGVQLAYGPGASAIAEDLRQTQTRITELNTKVSVFRKMLAEAHASLQTTQAISDQPDWSVLLGILGDTIGDDVVLRDIQLRPACVVPGKHYAIQLRGFARSQPGVSQYVLKLQDVGLFEDVKLLRTGREPVLNLSAVTFDISCEIRETAERRVP